MRIAIVTPTYPPYGGGIGAVAAAHCNFLANRGHDVTVFTPSYSGRKKINDSNVTYLKPLYAHGNAALLPFIVSKVKNFDVVHLHYPFFGAAEIMWLKSKKIKKKAAFVIHYHMDVVGNGLLGSFFAWHQKTLMPKIINSANAVIVTSIDYADTSAIKNSVSKKSNLYFEIPNGVDELKFYPQQKDISLLKKHGIKKNEKIILFVGGLDQAHYFKGVEYLLKAAKLIRIQQYDWKLVIVGKGDMMPSYKDMAVQLRIADRTIFTGYIPDELLPSYYNLADVVVLPSIDRSEAFGMVLVEAMSCGKPVIASDLPGVRSVVDDGYNGFLAAPKDSNELSTKINAVLTNPQLSEKMGEIGRRKVETKYGWSSIAIQLEKMYEKILHN